MSDFLNDIESLFGDEPKKKRIYFNPLYDNGNKYSLTIRLDRDIIEYFKAKGPGYQTRINDALKKFIKDNPDENGS